MVYHGRVKDGVVVVDDGHELAEGTVVRIEPIATGAGEDSQTLYERLKPVIGVLKGLPSDLAKNHDHYLHGRPKK